MLACVLDGCVSAVVCVDGVNIDFVVVSLVDVVDRCFAKPGATETRNDDDVGYVATCRLL